MTKDPIFIFADHVVSTGFDDIPVDAVAAAKTFILDTLGVGISGGAGPLAAELAAVGSKHRDTRAALLAYERARKPVTTAIMLESRFLGRLETQRGPGAAFRDAFFWAMDKTGVAKEVFLTGAMPRV